MSSARTATLAAAVLAVGVWSSAAGQENAPSAPPPAANTPSGGWHHEQMMHHCRDIDARLAAMLAYGEVKLSITQAQLPAWHKLAETLRGAEDPVRRVCAEFSQQPPAATLPARLDRIQKLAEAEAAVLRTSIPAIEQFYGTLSPDQKKIADEMVFHGGMMHGGMMHGGGE